MVKTFVVLGLPPRTPTPTAERLAWFFSRTEFAVVARSRIRGLRLEATDADFAVGDGPLVRGPVLSLLMAITGREAHLADLSGEGVSELAVRCAPTSSPEG